jgi:hypothetical protein
VVQEGKMGTNDILTQQELDHKLKQTMSSHDYKGLTPAHQKAQEKGHDAIIVLDVGTADE